MLFNKRDQHSECRGRHDRLDPSIKRTGSSRTGIINRLPVYRCASRASSFVQTNGHQCFQAMFYQVFRKSSVKPSKGIPFKSFFHINFPNFTTVSIFAKIKFSYCPSLPINIGILTLTSRRWKVVGGGVGCLNREGAYYKIGLLKERLIREEMGGSA